MARSIKPEDLLELRIPTSLVVSPDGRRLAFCMDEPDPDEGKNFSHIFLADCSAVRKRPQRLTTGKCSNEQPQWWPDGRSLAFISDRGGGKQVWRIPVTAGEPERLTDVPGEVLAFDVAPDGSGLLLRVKEPKSRRRQEAERSKRDVIVHGEDWQYTHLYWFDLDSRKLKRLTGGKFDVSQASLSPDGRYVAYLAADEPTYDGWFFRSRLVILDMRSGRRRQVQLDSVRFWHGDSPRFSPDGKLLAFTASASPEVVFQSAVWIADVRTGRARRAAEDLDRPHRGGRFSRDGRWIYMLVVDSVNVRLVRGRLNGRGFVVLSPQRGVAGDYDVGAGRDVCFQYARSDRAPQVYCTDGRRRWQVTRLNDRFSEISITPARLIRYTCDGWRVEALLKTPSGRGPWPLIVHPHGGPQGASLDGFQPHHDLFIRRGYALLMPNFRGSTGRGAAFLQRILDDWTDGPMRDIMAAVQWCVRNGIADAGRLGIYGASYGGFITCWIIGHSRLFRAAVAQCAVTDHISMYGTTDIPTFMELNLGGPPYQHFDKWWQQSPVAYVGDVRTPTLIITGLSDERVHPTQSWEYYRHLKATGTKCRLVMYPREGHAITEPNHRLDCFQRILDWFDVHLKRRRR